MAECLIAVSDSDPSNCTSFHMTATVITSRINTLLLSERDRIRPRRYERPVEFIRHLGQRSHDSSCQLVSSPIRSDRSARSTHRQRATGVGRRTPVVVPSRRRSSEPTPNRLPPLSARTAVRESGAIYRSKKVSPSTRGPTSRAPFSSTCSVPSARFHQQSRHTDFGDITINQ